MEKSLSKFMLFFWKVVTGIRIAREEYKFNRLKALLEHSEQHVPYYRDLFRKHGIKSADIKDFGDYAKIPILTKQILRENLDYIK